VRPTLKILITGAGGQLAWELAQTASTDKTLVLLGREQLNIADQAAVSAAIAEHQPDAVINAAAYTNVDAAESNREQAIAVNSIGVENLATACVKQQCYLLHVSTDFVFDGSANRPYKPDAIAADPLGVYGLSKLQGEQKLAAIMPNDWAILRTAWVYSAHGNNFVKTMLRLMREKPSLGVIADQIGSPTWAKYLAVACWAAVDKKLQGIHHCTGDGVASWYDFAVAIQELAIARGMLATAVPVAPIPTEAYPTPAQRPSYSVLNNQSLQQALPELQHEHWRSALAKMLDELKQLESKA
jgi:dTDP-4-dehydrorhamnose reductase (EC 1.1.1.133)